LNPKAWTNVPDGQFAASESSIRSFRGFRTPQESANFGRNFRIKERVNLNLRVEFTNVFNRMLYSSLTTPIVINTNFASAPVPFTSGPNKGLLSSGFGVVNPTAGTSNQRSGTFVARFQF